MSTDEIIGYFKNHKVLGPCIAIGVVFIALVSFSEALNKAYTHLFDNDLPSNQEVGGTETEIALYENIRDCMSVENVRATGTCQNNVRVESTGVITDEAIQICEENIPTYFYGGRPDLTNKLYWHVCYGRSMRINCSCDGERLNDPALDSE